MNKKAFYISFLIAVAVFFIDLLVEILIFDEPLIVSGLIAGIIIGYVHYHYYTHKKPGDNSYMPRLGPAQPEQLDIQARISKIEGYVALIFAIIFLIVSIILVFLNPRTAIITFVLSIIGFLSYFVSQRISKKFKKNA